MPVNLATLAEKTVKLEVKFADEVINAIYHPYKMTPKFRALLIGLDKDGGIGEGNKVAVAEMLSQMLASWDVELNGEPYPPTYDNLVDVPVEILGAVADSVWTDLGKRATNATEG